MTIPKYALYGENMSAFLHFHCEIHVLPINQLEIQYDPKMKERLKRIEKLAFIYRHLISLTNCFSHRCQVVFIPHPDRQ